MKLYTSYTDEQLFLLLQKRDVEPAFDELYARYWKKLMIRANILLDSQEDAEEIVHDIFVKLWRKRSSLQINYSFHTYISAMLRYACFETLTKKKLRREKEITGVISEKVDLSTIRWLEYKDLQYEIESAIQELPEKCQLIFRMSREKCLSNKEIAEQLNNSVNTVRTQIHRALQRLRVSLGVFL